MKPHLLTAVVVLCLVAADKPEEKDDELVGTWKVVSVLPKTESRLGPEMLMDAEIVCSRGGKVTISPRGMKAWKGTYAVDDTKKPKTLDYTYNTWGTKTEQLSLYAIEDDVLTLCFCWGVDERPKNLKVDELRCQSVLTLKRQKK